MEEHNDSDLEFEATDDITDTEDFVEVLDEDDSDFEGEDEYKAGEDDGEEEILYTSRHGFEWSSIPPPSSRRRGINIPTENFGLRNGSIHASTVREMFCLFIDDEMIRVVTEETNRHIYKKNPEQKNPISHDELYAFIGVLLASGSNGTLKLNLSDLWMNETPFCQPFFTATLSRDRFIIIYNSLRFDNKDTRVYRMQASSDKSEPIKWVFDKFVEACKTNYSPSSNVTVDQRLASYRGNCPFRVYMKSKPDKYGIKIWVAADSITAYIFNLEIYTGMKNNTIEINQGYRVVTEMVRPLYGTNRGVTTDNFFTSMNLADELLSNNLTITGTLRKNKGEIPPQFLPAKQRKIHSSIFGFTENRTLVSYVTDLNKAVVLLSTQYNDADVDTTEHQKPLIIHHYNKTKIGVDKGDQMTRKYSCVRSTRRWPFRIFMEIIDMAALNAYLLWITKHPEWKKNNKYRRKHFIRELSLELAQPNIIKRRTSNVKYHKQQLGAFDAVLLYCGDMLPNTSENNMSIEPREPQKRGTCNFCSKDLKKRTKLFCNTCNEPVCIIHRVEKKNIFCPKCTSE